MSLTAADRRDLRWQLATLSDQAITVDQFRKLHELVKTDDEARQLYVEHLFLDALLHWSIDKEAGAGIANPDAAQRPAVSAWAPTSATLTPLDESGAAEDPFRSLDAGPAAPLLGFLGTAVNLVGTWLASPKILALAVLGSLATYFVGLIISIAISRALLTDRNAQQRAELPAAAQARIIVASGCRWQDRSPRADLGGRLPAGTSRMAEGILELEFDGGARVRIEGPAEFAPRSGQRLELTQGVAVAYVPRRARGFTVGTPTAEVIDLGTEFGVQVEGDGKTEVHVLRGVVEVKNSAVDVAENPSGSVRVSAGSAVRVGPGRRATSIDFDGPRFVPPATAIATTPHGEPSRARRAAQPFRMFFLGNLFDDAPGTSLEEALQTDTFRAGADANDLGVDRVVYGGQSLKEIAPGVKFDLTNLGWGKGELRLQVANDAWSADFGGLRLTGQPLSDRAPRINEGIGMSSSSLLTFDLDEIRTAGKLGPQAFEFVCDSAGVNDSGWSTNAELKMTGGGSIHLLVLVLSGSDVLSANVDGMETEVVKHAGTWSVAKPPLKALHTYGPYISVRQPIPAEAKYLTLVSAGAGDGHWDDHGAWIGARLETIEIPSAPKARSER